MRIGVFDSGIGGINVLSCLRKKYPHNDYVYYGDTINLPYGVKSKDKINKLSNDAVEFLLSKNVELIIIACGTSSATSYEILKNKYDIPIYDIITPTIEYLNNSNFNNIGVIATNRTIESKIFNNINKDIVAKATPSFVPIIENNLIIEKENEIINELAIFKNSDILVFGCTHYPLLKPITDKMGINTLDMGEVLTNKLNLENKGNSTCELYFSLISVNLVNNINNILNDYNIYQK